MKIKVCGLRDPQNICDVLSLGPDYVGFIFYARSPRNALLLPPESVAALHGGKGVGVFVDSPAAYINDICSLYRLSAVQLHGSESPSFCSELSASGLTVFKAVGISESVDWHEVAAYEGCVDMFVFDTLSSSHGGTGRKFDWSVLSRYPLSVPYLLSGGIAPGDDIPDLPGLAGVDLNSRFEDAPGMKNIEKLRKFFEK